MSNRIEINLTGIVFTDEIHYNVGAAAFKLSDTITPYPDPIENAGSDFFTKEDLVIRDTTGGGGNLLAEGAGNDYLLSEEDTDLTTRVTAAVGSTRTVYQKIQIINAVYQDVDLYFSGKYIADSNSGEDFNWIRNRPQETNDIINGSMELNQRSTPGATYTGVADGEYTLDRFEYQLSGGAVHNVIHDSSFVPDGVNYSYKLDCTTTEAVVAAGDYTIVSTKIEGYNYQKYIGNTATLSFEVANVKTGIYCVAFRNSGTDRTYIVEYEIHEASTIERKIITVDFDYTGGTWNTTNGTGLEIDWVVVAGTDHHGAADIWLSTADFATSNQVNGADNTANNFWLAKVKFEPGDRATKFWSPDIREEVANCQRFYEKTYGIEIAPGTVTTAGEIFIQISAVASADHSIDTPWFFKVSKRTIAPTIQTYETTAGVANRVRMAAGVVTPSNKILGLSDQLTNIAAPNGAASTNRLLRFQATAEDEL